MNLEKHAFYALFAVAQPCEHSSAKNSFNTTGRVASIIDGWYTRILQGISLTIKLSSRQLTISEI